MRPVGHCDPTTQKAETSRICTNTRTALHFTFQEKAKDPIKRLPMQMHYMLQVLRSLSCHHGDGDGCGRPSRFRIPWVSPEDVVARIN
jgi:hypothetical protein